MASARLEDVTGIKEELIREALSTAMKSQKSQEKQYLREKTKLAVLFGFPGSFSADEWFYPSNQKSFGETKINRDRFPCLRSIISDEDATVNEAFLRKFEALLHYNRLKDEVEKAVNERKQIVFTGHSSGGAVATLLTVWCLENYYPKPDQTRFPPFCVTFGSPLVGDRIFNHALKRENWAHYFVHFVTKYDIAPRIMLSPKSSIEQSLPQILCFLNPKSLVSFPEASAFYITVMRNMSSVASYVACQLMRNTNPLLETVSNFIELSPYRPFGTYVFCTNGRLVGVNNPDAILQLLFYSCQLGNEGEGPQIAYQSIKDHQNYENILQGFLVTNLSDKLDQLLLTLDEAEPNTSAISVILSDLGLSTRGRLCIRAAGEAEKQRTENQQKVYAKKDEIASILRWLEEDYKNMCENRRVDYYDSFKAAKDEIDFKANVKRLELAGIWDKIIEMLKKYELPDGFERREEWINIGTLYRRLVEPLDIANYYRHLKNEDTGPYMKQGRPTRYKYTQRWLEYAQWKATGTKPEVSFWSEVAEINRTYNLGSIQDIEKEFVGSKCESCFWAEVEELNGKSYESIQVRALILERMLEKWISNREIGTEMLMEESTFVTWWKKLPDHHKFRSRVPGLMQR